MLLYHMLQLKTDKNRELRRIPKTISIKLVNLRPGALLRAESTTVSVTASQGMSRPPCLKLVGQTNEL